MTSSSSIQLSIVVVNWNSKDFVAACLESIYRSNAEATFEVIVVDGGSFDGCGDMIAARFPKVVFIQSDKNIGFGRSNNLGFSKAKGKHVLLLNPDTEVEPGSLDSMIHALETLPNVGAIGPRILNTDRTLQRSCVQPLPTPLNQALDSDFLRRLLPHSKLWSLNSAFERSEATSVQALSGACIAMPSSLFKQIGGFTPDYFMYAEDMDLCLKVQRAGFQVYHIPYAEIVHHGGGSSQTTFSKFSVVMNLHALGQYMHINHGEFAKLRFRIFMMTSALVRSLLIGVARTFSKPPKREARKCSQQRWFATLRWSLGLEKWVRSYLTP